jgi:threonine dehydrogenase-like Zn-dependent dehydrogenase
MIVWKWSASAAPWSRLAFRIIRSMQLNMKPSSGKNAHLIAVVTPEWSEYLLKVRDLFLENRNALERLVTHRLQIQDAAKTFTLYERHEDGILKALIDTTYW